MTKISKLKILAIDPMSTFATFDGKQCNTYSVSKKKSNLSFYNKILDIFNVGKGGHKYKAIILEASNFPYIASKRIFYYQRGVIKMLCELSNIPLIEYAPISIKKSFTGKTKATKEQMIKEAKKRGFKVKNDHEADAVALYFHHLGVADVKK